MADHNELFAPFKEKMTASGIDTIVIDTFEYYFETLLSKEKPTIPCSDISPVTELSSLNDFSDDVHKPQELLRELIVIKLNGGLGTSMGLDKAKSLLPAKGELTFLDIIIRQNLALAKRYDAEVPLLFMNSFRTDEDTKALLSRYPELEKKSGSLPLTFLQNQIPKVCAKTYAPLRWLEDPRHEWCPPGHGDIYTVLKQTGTLEAALDSGKRYAFISNADNLAASVDLRILDHISKEKIPFLMEVATRTQADKKGGHLAADKEGNLLLREVAQCPDEDMDSFQDYKKYSYFNTNSLWVDLQVLKEVLEGRNNILGLPLICNKKRINPKQDTSPEVFQLETAMGAAISVFEKAQALHVPRSRFLPIKTTDELIGLMSDRFEFDEQTAILTKTEDADELYVALDRAYFGQVEHFVERFSSGIPSLKSCNELLVKGDFFFEDDIICRGQVELVNKSKRPITIKKGTILEGTKVYEE